MSSVSCCLHARVDKRLAADDGRRLHSRSMPTMILLFIIVPYAYLYVFVCVCVCV